MCIAIWKNENKIIDKETLARCFTANPDGAGFMYPENGKLHVKKGYFRFEDFYKAYQPHENKQCVIHFRIKTHGSVSVDNCHPFNITKEFGFVHNGVISGYGVDDISDTRDFNHKILQPLVKKWGNLSLFEPAIKTLIESKIGYSKLIFLDKHGNAEIFNDIKGEWSDDANIWYSNGSYKPYTPPPALTTQSYSSYGSYYPKPSSTPKPEQSKLFETKSKAHQILAVDDLVTFNKPYWDNDLKYLAPKDSLWEVVAVNNDYTADLMSEDDGPGNAVFLYNVSFAKLDFYDEDEFVTKDVWADSYYCGV
jgi:hypothetical protein